MFHCYVLAVLLITEHVFVNVRVIVCTVLANASNQAHQLSLHWFLHSSAPAFNMQNRQSTTGYQYMHLSAVECIIVCITLLNQNMQLDASLNRKIFPFYLYSCTNETVTEKMQSQQCGRPLTRQFVVHMQYAIIIYIKVILYRMMKLQTIMFAPFPTYSILFMLYHIYIYLLASHSSIKTLNAEQLKCPLSVFIR